MSEVAIPNDSDDGELSLFETALGRRGGADFVFSQSTVVRRDDKHAFIGVPFVVTEVTFQRVPDVPEDEGPGYVTLAGRIAPAKFVHQAAMRGFIPNIKSVDGWIDSYGYQPGEAIVINDGGKGIRRQIVEQFHIAGLITVPELDTPFRQQWKNKYDLPYTEWEEFQQTDVRADGTETYPKFTKGPSGNDLLILVERGLRASKDPLAPVGHSDTFYLS